MRVQEIIFRVVARLLMMGAFVLGWTTLLSFAAMLSARQLPPLDNVLGLGVTVMVSELALWCWWSANTLAHLQRSRVSVGGIDRNPRRHF